jgi:predicted PurR-regulated permease PerM
MAHVPFMAREHRLPEPPEHAGLTIARTIQVIAIIAGVALLLWLLSDIVLLIFLAVLIAAILRGISDWAAQHTGLRQGVMLAIVSLLAAGCMVGFLYYLGPRLASESQDLWKQFQTQISTLHQDYGNTRWGKAIFASLQPSSAVKGHIANVAGSVATSTLGGVATAFVLIVTALYFAISPQLYVHGVVLLFPIPYRGRAQHVMNEVGQTLQWWSLGQSIDMLVVGLLTGFGLDLLGVPLALALGALAGLLTFVPYFGTIISAVPAMLVALTVSWQTSLWALVIFLGAHTIEGYVVSPLVQRRTVHLPPAVSILAMTILGTIFGPLGVILGTPVAAALLVVVREAYVGGFLGDQRAANGDSPDAALEAGPPPA